MVSVKVCEGRNGPMRSMHIERIDHPSEDLQPKHNSHALDACLIVPLMVPPDGVRRCVICGNVNKTRGLRPPVTRNGDARCPGRCPRREKEGGTGGLRVLIYQSLGVAFLR